jgi:hypothetical protein
LIGWLRLERDDSLILSKDGILLQIISIWFRPHKNTFEKIEKDSSTCMLPSELAQLAIAEFGDTPQRTGRTRRSHRL